MCQPLPFLPPRPRRFGVAAFVTLVVALCTTALAAPAPPAEIPLPRPAVEAAADVDLAACQLFTNGAVPGRAAAAAGVLNVLGLGTRGATENWVAGHGNGQDATRFQYRLVFRQPVAMGSLFLRGSGRFTIRTLKPDAAVTAGPADAAAWVPVAVPASQSAGQTVTFATGFQTQALLFEDAREHGRSEIYLLRLYASRLHNLTPAGTANAEAEYTLYPQMSPPVTFAARRVTEASGSWQNCGPNKWDKILRPAISDVAPSWFALSWWEPQTVCGFFLADNFAAYELASYRGPDGLNPAVATEKEWGRIREFSELRTGGGRLVFFRPLTTRGLRVKVTRSTEGPIAAISGFQVFTDLGDAPVPEVKKVDETPPLRIPFQLEQDGRLTLVVDDPKGKRVSNVVARVERKKGANEVAWDLQDRRGNYIVPGTYTWKAITHPPLELRYQTTAYPNVGMVAPENAPWLTGQSGAGGWMADHAPPLCVAAAGETVYLSSPVCESGVGLIEVTLAGRKSWGTGNILAWTSPAKLASDGQAVYASAGFNDVYGHGAFKEYLWRVDPATKQIKVLYAQPQTDMRNRGITGLEARDGKVYVAVRAANAMFANACGANDVDLPNCAPVYTVQPVRSKVDEAKPNPQNDFLRLLRFKDDVAGHRNRGGSLIWLKSTSFPASRNHLVVAFLKPVPVGSLVLPLPEEDIRMSLSVLKPEAPYPPQARRDEHWTTFYSGRARGWAVLPAPPKTVTRAVRVSFSKTDDDLDEALDGEEIGDKAALEEGDTLGKGDTGGGAKKRVTGAIEGMKILRRAFENLMPAAQVRVNSGKVDELGEWDAQRTEPLSTEKPAVYVMEWKEAQPLRGLAIKEIDGKQTEIDVFEGPAGEAVNLEGMRNWRRVAGYEQRRRDCYDGYSQSYNADARYLDGYVDFGAEITTRAVRLRIVEQWTTRTRHPTCIRWDRGFDTLDPRRCHVYGVAPLRYAATEDPVDPRVSERLEIVDAAKGTVLQELAAPNLGHLQFTPAGELLGLSGNKVIQLDLSGNGQHRDRITDLVKPTALAADKEGHVYVFDAAPDRRLVRVYATDGTFARAIGIPGGLKAGPWNTRVFGEVADLDIDKSGQLWAVEKQYFPKRISVWDAATGTFRREHLGNTAYGGGGVLDPVDQTRLVYGPMEFVLDWDKGTSRLKNLTWTADSDIGNMFNPSAAGEVPIRVNGRTYFVTRTEFGRQAAGVVYLYENDRLRRVAALGLANGFGALRSPQIQAALKGQVIANLQFLWTDRNGDGNPQPEEVQFTPTHIRNLCAFDRTLGVQAGKWRYEVQEFLPDGAPVYVEKPCPQLPDDAGWRLDNGNYFFFRGDDCILSPAGETIASYPTEGYGVHALFKAAPWRVDQVVAEFDVVGHETTQAGDLGEFLVTNSNLGTWNIWTADGLLAGNLFRDYRDPKCQGWSMPEHPRGLRLEECTLSQEHFAGYFCKTTDNRYYAVAGHNHASVVEVVGMDKFKRLQGQITVTDALLGQARDWAHAMQRRRSYESAKVIDCAQRGESLITIDGDDSDWPVTSASIDIDPTIATDDGDLLFCMLADNAQLYLCWSVRGHGPMKNSGTDWHTYYKTGACVDLQLGALPGADPNRKSPVEGDSRLLLTVIDNKPVAVLYRAVVPGTPADQIWKIHTMVMNAAFDRVEKLEEARLSCKGDENGYVFEAAIPLARLGLKPDPDQRLKVDWGVLVSGKDGNEVLQRLYWANKATAITADVAAEAELHPDLWGFLRFSGKSAGVPQMDPGAAGGKDDAKIDKLLHDLGD